MYQLYHIRRKQLNYCRRYTCELHKKTTVHMPCMLFNVRSDLVNTYRINAIEAWETGCLVWLFINKIHRVTISNGAGCRCNWDTEETISISKYVFEPEKLASHRTINKHNHNLSLSSSYRYSYKKFLHEVKIKMYVSLRSQSLDLTNYGILRTFFCFML